MKKPSKALIGEIKEIIRVKHHLLIMEFDSYKCADEVKKAFKGLSYKKITICEIKKA